MKASKEKKYYIPSLTQELRFLVSHLMLLRYWQVPKLYRPLEVATAAGHFLRIEERVVVDFYIHDVRLSDEFYVVPGLSEDAILGVNTFQKWRIKLDLEHDSVIVDPKLAKAMLK